MILILDDQHQWSFQKEKPLVFLIQHPFIIVSTQRWENLTNIFLCLEPNHITILEGSVQYYFEIPMHICIRKLYFLTAVNFSFAYCNSSSEGLASEGWRLNLIDTGLFVFCFVFFFNVGFFHYVCFVNTLSLKLSLVNITILGCLCHLQVDWSGEFYPCFLHLNQFRFLPSAWK